MSTTTVQSNFDSGDRLWFKIGALSFILGIALLIAVSFLHPHQSNPSDNPTIFAEYAADRRWIGTHLMQLFGTMLFMVPSFLAIYRSFAMDGNSVGNLARFGMAVSLLTFAIYAIDMGIDGIALKKAVDKLVVSTGAEQAVYFSVAEGIRWLENGVLGIAGIFQGLAVLVMSVAMVQSAVYAKWVGWLGILGGLAFFIGGFGLLASGFSAIMVLAQLGFYAILIWVFAAAFRLWRL